MSLHSSTVESEKSLPKRARGRMGPTAGEHEGTWGPRLVSMRAAWGPRLVRMRVAWGPGLVRMRVAWGQGWWVLSAALAKVGDPRHDHVQHRLVLHVGQ